MAINLGTATPSAFYLGSTAISKLYLGSTQVWPVVASNKLAIARNNGNGSTASFSGTGVYGAPYARSAGYYYDDAEGVSHYTFTLNASGTVYMSCNCADETDSGQTFSFRKNGTAFATSGNGGQSGFSANTTGSSGDVFKITANSASGSWSTQLIDTVSIYAT